VRGPLLVTGGGGGIGKAVASLALRAGEAVALVDLDEERLSGAVDELRVHAGTEPLPIACDVTDEADVSAAFESTADRLGRPQSVVTAAGIDYGELLHALEARAWDRVLSVNLRGTFLVCRAALRHMLEGDGGSIVCISSPLAFVATPGGSSAYSASKGGVSALVRSLAVDYARRGIRVNALLPGPTETDLMWANVTPAEVDRMREKVADEVPIGRLASPEEVARAALWLLSEDASYVTGAQVPCDGGMLAKASVSV
jgi:NAD(P)-dependent dehydrogenase (short-subunit alcohol dehydrogenase family)